MLLLTSGLAAGVARPITGPWPKAFPAKQLCSNCGLCRSAVGVASVTEACAFLGESTEETVRAAQDFSDSRVVDEYKRIARSHGVWLSCSVQEKSSQADKV